VQGLTTSQRQFRSVGISVDAELRLYEADSITYPWPHAEEVLCQTAAPPAGFAAPADPLQFLRWDRAFHASCRTMHIVVSGKTYNQRGSAPRHRQVAARFGLGLSRVLARLSFL
jgi:hypothetical protein